MLIAQMAKYYFNIPIGNFTTARATALFEQPGILQQTVGKVIEGQRACGEWRMGL
jgi:hypothetical protein